MNLKFLRFDATPTEKHLGIATVRVEEGVRIILRFKVQPKEGGGYYYQPASHKISAHGKDNYYPAFSLDSSYEYDELKEFLAVHVEPILQQQNGSSIFAPQPQARPPYVAPAVQQPNPNYGGYPQQQAPVQQQQYRQDRPQQQSFAPEPEERLPF